MFVLKVVDPSFNAILTSVSFSLFSRIGKEMFLLRAAWLLFLLRPILTLFSCVSAFDTERTFSSAFHALFITFPRIVQGRLLLPKLVCKLSFPHDAPFRTKATLNGILYQFIG